MCHHILLLVTSAYASTIEIRTHQSNMDLIMRLGSPSTVPAGRFSGVRLLGEFSEDEIARLHGMVQAGPARLAQEFMQMEGADGISSDDITKKVATTLEEIETAYGQYMAFHAQLQAHPELFAVSTADVLLMRAYLRKFARAPTVVQLAFPGAVLRTEEIHSQVVLCKWFKIGLREYLRQVALYIPNGHELPEITGDPHIRLLFDDHVKACVELHI